MNTKPHRDNSTTNNSKLETIENKKCRQTHRVGEMGESGRDVVIRLARLQFLDDQTAPSGW